MTTIAWDGWFLAVDGGVWLSGGAVGTCDKLVTITAQDGGDLLGWYAQAGYAWRCEMIRAWLREGRGQALDLPDTSKDDSHGVFVTAPDRRAYVLEGPRVQLVRVHPPYALGAGGALAMGAMLAGVDAIDAVQLAVEQGDGAAGWVDSVNVKSGVRERRMPKISWRVKKI